MTYSEYKNQYKSQEESRNALAKLSEKEIRELISNEETSTTVKACMFQSWKNNYDADNF